MYIPVLTSTPPSSMGMNSSLHRLLNDPDSREREVLEADLIEKDDDAEGNATPSFLNTLAGDLDARVVGIHKNTNQRLIIVTQDKTLLTLKRNIARLGKKEWIAPLSTLTTIMIALITSNFKRALGLGPAEWRAIFIVCGFVTAGWLGLALKRSIGAKTFHEVICDICYELGARKKTEGTCTAEKAESFSTGASATFAACKSKVRSVKKNVPKARKSTKRRKRRS